ERAASAHARRSEAARLPQTEPRNGIDGLLRAGQELVSEVRLRRVPAVRGLRRRSEQRVHDAGTVADSETARWFALPRKLSQHDSGATAGRWRCRDCLRRRRSGLVRVANNGSSDDDRVMTIQKAAILGATG